MTRIMRMRLSVGERTEWVSLIAGDKPDSHRAIPEDGEEFEFTDNKREPLETQISRILAKRNATVSD